MNFKNDQSYKKKKVKKTPSQLGLTLLTRF